MSQFLKAMFKIFHYKSWHICISIQCELKDSYGYKIVKIGSCSKILRMRLILNCESHYIYSSWIPVAWADIFHSVNNQLSTLLSEHWFWYSFKTVCIFQSDPYQWLQKLGLEIYKPNFQRNHIKSAQDMEALKSFSKKDIKKELGIKKTGKVY